jgi:hypothetical protein
MALSKSAAEKVAKEKERASLGMGDSPAKAARYAQEVRAYARREREKGN